MSRKLNSRAVAAKACWRVIDHDVSLDAALKGSNDFAGLEPQDKGFAQELSYGVCRWYGDLNHVSQSLLNKPIRKKDRIIHFVLLVGLYQLRHIKTAPHAAVDETVKATQQLQKGWAKNLINGCLRKYSRTDNTDALSNGEWNDMIHRRTFPSWIFESIREAWPDYVQQTIRASNARPPMCLRNNQRRQSRDDYLQQLDAAEISASADPFTTDGIILANPVAVSSLPGFDTGSVSVQDTAAQLACDILQVEPDLKVLDACAAPGGKTAHLLERCDSLAELHAMEISAPRHEQLQQTLERLELEAVLILGDASLDPDESDDCAKWHPPQQGYDRILIDAPCSGTGVIRRHPDIKHHRTPQGLISLQQTQFDLLSNLWTHLTPGGLMLYMTCSIFPCENSQQIGKFLRQTDDAQVHDFEHPNALNLEFGKQTLPGVHGMDGFYYCLLQKQVH